MADEAVIRIILDDGGRSQSAQPSQSNSAPAPRSAGTPPPQPTKQPSTPPPAAGSGPAPSPAVVPTDLTDNTPTPQTSVVPPTVSQSNPLPVEVVSAAPPPPPPAAAPYVAGQEPEWLRSLINPEKGTNPHVLMEGQSGSGKSVATRHIAMQRMAQGQEVHVLDPHTPESWGGAKQVFQGESAGAETAKFMEDLLKKRIAERQDALNKGVKAPDFTPVTMVLSDFAAIAKNTPALQEVIKQMLTEGRKFNIAVLADTTALTGAESGIHGINNVLANFRQKARFYAPTDTEGRKARIGGAGGEEFPVPQLPDYKDRVDYSLVKPTSETGVTGAVGAAAVARRRYEKEKYEQEVEAEYAKLVPPKVEPTFDPMEVALKRIKAEEQRAAADAAYAKLKPPKPPEAKSTFDSLLGIAESLRGTLGGTFGKVVGATLDATAAIRKIKAKGRERAEYAANANTRVGEVDTTTDPYDVPSIGGADRTTPASLNNPVPEAVAPTGTPENPIAGQPVDDPSVNTPDPALVVPAYATGTTDSGDPTKALVHPGERVIDMSGGRRDVGNQPVLADLPAHSVVLPKDLAEATRRVPPGQEPAAVDAAVAQLHQRQGTDAIRLGYKRFVDGPGEDLVDFEEAEAFLNTPEAGYAALRAFNLGAYSEINEDPGNPVSQAMMDLVDRLPDAKAKELVRVMAFNTVRERNDFLNTLGRKGDVYVQERTFASWNDAKQGTAQGDDIADQYGDYKVVMYLRNPVGAKDITPLVGGGEGDEVLTRIGDQQRIRGYKKDGDDYIVKMESVGPPPPISVPAYADGTTDSGATGKAVVHPGERIVDMTGGKRDVGDVPVVANLAPHSIVLPEDLAEQTRNVPPAEEPAAVDSAVKQLEERKNNFNKWFEGSKVVDEQGNPVVAYHGTPWDQFNEFKKEKLGHPEIELYGPGFYFTESEAVAKQYQELGSAIPGAGGGEPVPKGQGHLFKTFLSLQKQFDVDKDRLRHQDVVRAGIDVKDLRSVTIGGKSVDDFTDEDWNAVLAAYNSADLDLDKHLKEWMGKSISETEDPLGYMKYLFGDKQGLHVSNIEKHSKLEKLLLGAKGHMGYLDKRGPKDAAKFRKALKEAGMPVKFTNQKNYSYQDLRGIDTPKVAITSALEDLGYDSITHIGHHGARPGSNIDGVEQHRVHIVLPNHANKIKSVDNVGTFDPETPDIRYATGTPDAPGGRAIVDPGERVIPPTRSTSASGLAPAGTPRTATTPPPAPVVVAPQSTPSGAVLGAPVAPPVTVVVEPPPPNAPVPDTVAPYSPSPVGRNAKLGTSQDRNRNKTDFGYYDDKYPEYAKQPEPPVQFAQAGHPDEWGRDSPDWGPDSFDYSLDPEPDPEKPKKKKDTKRKLADAIVGERTSKIADMLGDAGGGMGGKVGSVMEKTADIIPVIAASTIAITALTSVASGMAEKYGEYSPMVAQQQAMAEIRLTLGNMRRAQEGQQELAEYVKAQSEMQNKWEDVKMAMMKKIVPVLSGIFEVMGQLLGIASNQDVNEIQDPTTVLLNRGLKFPDSQEF